MPTNPSPLLAVMTTKARKSLIETIDGTIAAIHNAAAEREFDLVPYARLTEAAQDAGLARAPLELVGPEGRNIPELTQGIIRHETKVKRPGDDGTMSVTLKQTEIGTLPYALELAGIISGMVDPHATVLNVYGVDGQLEETWTMVITAIRLREAGPGVLVKDRGEVWRRPIGQEKGFVLAMLAEWRQQLEGTQERKKRTRTPKGSLPEWVIHALFLANENAEWTDSKIAEELGEHRSTLSRNQSYQQMVAKIREVASRSPRKGNLKTEDGGFDGSRTASDVEAEAPEDSDAEEERDAKIDQEMAEEEAQCNKQRNTSQRKKAKNPQKNRSSPKG